MGLHNLQAVFCCQILVVWRCFERLKGLLEPNVHLLAVLCPLVQGVENQLLLDQQARDLKGPTLNFASYSVQ